MIPFGQSPPPEDDPRRHDDEPDDELAAAQAASREASAALVTIATFSDPNEAQLARNRLKAAGIRAVLADEMMMSTAWHLNNAIGGIKLQVQHRDVQRADKVLRKLEQKKARRRKTDPQLPGDALASRALNWATLGIFIGPGLAHLYAATLLLRLRWQGLELSRTGRKEAREAYLINCMVLGGIGLLAALVIGLILCAWRDSWGP